MKRFITIISVIHALLLAAKPLQALNTCHVVAKSGSAAGSLPWQVDRINQGKCNQVLFTTMKVPLQLKLSAPLILEADYQAMISGGNYGSGEPLAPLGLVIDARAVAGCALLIEDPSQLAVKYLSFWVNDADEALCNFDGESLLRTGSPAFVGDLLKTHYNHLQICSGPNDKQLCTEAPLPPKPKNPNKLAPVPLPPEPPGPDADPLPPGLGDVQNCSDSDDDGICDVIDKCNLAPSNPKHVLLAAIMAEQCPNLLLGKTDDTPLCSQTQDLDQDSTGNACDADADGDSFLNSLELWLGTDPLDAFSFPSEPAPGEQGASGEATASEGQEDLGSDTPLHEDEKKDDFTTAAANSCTLNSAGQAPHSFNLGMLMGLGWILLLVGKQRRV